MNKEPLVSIIINTSGTNLINIENLIKSIASQTFNHYEIIVATETNYNIIYNICKKYILLRNKCKIIMTGFWNRCKTANVAIKFAKGKYIALLEDDLILHSQWLSNAIKILEYTKNYRVGCIYSTIINPYGSESLVTMIRHPILKFIINLINILRIHYALIKRNIVVFSLSTVCYKDVLFKAGLFDVTVDEPIVAEDYDLALRIIKFGYKIIKSNSLIAYHYSKHFTKRVNDISKKGIKWWERLTMNELYLFTKHIDIFDIYTLTHVIYKIIFEPINVFIRLSSKTFSIFIKIWLYTIRGTLLGFIKGLLNVL